MTQARKRARFALIIWGFIALIFLLVFFSEGGPETFKQDKMRIAGTAALLAAGYISYSAMLYLTRIRDESGPKLRDERDDWIASKVNSVTLIAVLLFIYIACIALWISYDDIGVVPVGWMWFLAYFSGLLAYIFHAIITLLYDSGMVDHA
jgi:hypothetical protein